MSLERYKRIAATAILGAWLVLLTLNAIDRSYHIPSEVDIAVGAVVMWLFAPWRFKGEL